MEGRWRKLLGLGRPLFACTLGKLRPGPSHPSCRWASSLHCPAALWQPEPAERTSTPGREGWERRGLISARANSRPLPGTGGGKAPLTEDSDADGGSDAGARLVRGVGLAVVGAGICAGGTWEGQHAPVAALKALAILVPGEGGVLWGAAHHVAGESESASFQQLRRWQHQDAGRWNAGTQSREIRTRYSCRGGNEPAEDLDWGARCLQNQKKTLTGLQNGGEAWLQTEPSPYASISPSLSSEMGSGKGDVPTPGRTSQPPEHETREGPLRYVSQIDQLAWKGLARRNLCQEKTPAGTAVRLPSTVNPTVDSTNSCKANS